MTKVFFMDDRAQSNQTSLVAKMLTLFDAAGFGDMIKPNDVVAIKLHMGEFNNTAYIRPVYVRALVDKIKSLGGDPMVVDTTTLPYFTYSSRVTALDHLKTVARNGFSMSTVGCPIVIADGFVGTDDIRVDLPEGFILKEQYVGAGIALADSMILLSHFKGHPLGTFGGALKNMGVGCASKRGKLNLHLGGHPKYGLRARPYVPERCVGDDCANFYACSNICSVGALTVTTEEKILWKKEQCVGCLACFPLLAVCGVAMPPDDYFDVTAAAISDSALATAKILGEGKIGYINLALDVVPFCDCVTYSDRALVPNLGVFASWDPVAIDSACLQKATEAAGIPGSVAEEKAVMLPGQPKFTACGSFMGISQEIQPNVGEKIGLGSRKYELIEVPPLDDDTSFTFTQIPVGAKHGKLFAKKEDIYPPGGFKRNDEVDIEDMR